MIETFRSFDLMLQAYWVMAGVASIVFIIQAVMTFVGFDADTDMDASGGDSDFDSEGFHLISVKTIICFLLGFGWTGVLFWDDIESPWLLALLATLIGFAFMSLIAYLLFLVMKLDKDNSFRIEQTIGQKGEVYLTIPAGGNQTGKVMVSVNGSMHELEAKTNDAEKIPTGEMVRITGVEAGNVLVVEKA